MAIIKCSKCAKEILDKALKCPYCEKKISAYQNKQPTESANLLQALVSGALVGSFLVSGIIGTWYLFHPNEPQSSDLREAIQESQRY